MYAVMTRDLKAYSHGPTMEYDVGTTYDKEKEYVLNPKSPLYGNVLVRMKRVKCGAELKIRICWHDWYWKPHIRWRICKHIHWLCFKTWFSIDYDNVPDKVVKDHLAEVNG